MKSEAAFISDSSLTNEIYSQARVYPIPNLLAQPSLMISTGEFRYKKAIIIIELGAQIILQLFGS